MRHSRGELRDRYRCVVPELPFGAHTTPMFDGADLSLPVIATFLAELDLHQVKLICNDWATRTSSSSLQNPKRSQPQPSSRAQRTGSWRDPSP
ncbi:MAG: hypothetical protein F4004_03915 [Acidimicrobiia bacterium]|nr:hypothetical protein [Acidimicrobiia bacterium]MYC43944.1 hypothetical protein [Acidimicrobiia bacterium]